MNMHKKIALLFVLSFFSLNSFSQSNEAVKKLSNLVCDCLTDTENPQNEEEFQKLIQACMVKSFTDDMTLFSNAIDSSDTTKTNNEKGQELGFKVGQYLTLTCESFQEKVKNLQDQLVTSEPEDSVSALSTILRGNTLMEAGKCSEAIPLYNKVIQLDNFQQSSYKVTAFNNRGYCKSELGDYYGAITDLSVALEINPNYSFALNNRGEAKLLIGDFNSAILDFNKSIEIAPDLTEAYNNLGLAYYYKENFSSAYSNYHKAISLDSTNGSFHFNLGLVDFSTENYESAIVNFQKAKTLSNEITDFSYYLSSTYKALGFYEKAIDILKDDPETAFDYINLNDIGLNYYSLEQYDSAITYFDKSILIEPNSPTIYLNRGYAFYDYDKKDLAFKDFDKTAALDSTNIEGLYMKSVVYYDLGEFKLALAELSHTINMYNDVAELYAQRGRTKMQLEDYKGAYEDFTSSIEIFPNDYEVYTERGKAYLGNKDVELACKDFSTSQALGAEDVEELISTNCSKN